MRKALLVVLTASIMVTMGCTTKPNPRKPKVNPSKFPTTASVVELCIDLATRVRYEYHWCDDEEGYVLVYVDNSATFPAELPADGEVLGGGQARLQPPDGSKPERIPSEGAIFTRK